MQIVRCRLGIVGFVEKIAKLAQPLQPLAPCAMAREHETAQVWLGRLVHRDVEAIFRQPILGAIGPFQNCDAAVEQILEPELLEVGRLHPIEIAMMDGEAIGLVALDQGEARAGHLAAGAKPRDQRPRESRLAGAERSLQARSRRQASARWRCGSRACRAEPGRHRRASSSRSSRAA